MERVAQEIYDRIDNRLYDSDVDLWWEPNSALHLIHHSLNPLRLCYLKRKLTEIGIAPRGKTALEVGCGGGLLCEEIAGLGFETTGVDPSGPSLEQAIWHARLGGLNIRYLKGHGEELPFDKACFDAVFCCDVLEHVRDLPMVISEISRVLKPGGIFYYDTLNRTATSKLVAIKICQQWKRYALAPPNLHIWEMFIKPEELRGLLEENHLQWKEHRGMRPNLSLLGVLRCLRQRVRKELTFRDLGERLSMVETADLSLMYLGYALKKSN